MTLHDTMFVIFASTYFRESLIFTIELFEYFARTYFHEFHNLRFFEYFAVTYFRKFRDLANFLHFARTIKVVPLGYFRKFHNKLILRMFCENKFRNNANFENTPRTYFSENKFTRKLVLTKISTSKVNYFRIFKTSTFKKNSIL